jgi:putative acetyltransferase
LLRQAFPHDAAAIAGLHRNVRKAALPYLPDLHSPSEDLAFFADYFLPEHDVWVWDDGGVVAYCGFGEGWLDHLYVDPAWHGRGIGTVLLDVAKDRSDRLSLWVFQKNTRAIAFYERNGFRLIEKTDGQGNEEKEPDARYRWLRGA